MPAASLLSLDLAVRGGACVVLALTALLLLRDHGRAPAARLAAAFAASALAYAVSSAAGFPAAAGPWGWPVSAVAVGVNLLFWLLARALFDDGFELRPRHAALWLLVATFGLAQAASADLGPPALARALGSVRSLQAVGFALAAALQAAASWRADLVEPRRRLRLFVVAATLAHTLATVAAAVAAAGSPGPGERLADMTALAAIALVIAWSLLRISADGVLVPAPDPAPRARELSPPDRRLAGELERVMEVERLYRQEGLSIGRLAQRLGAPEHRLRRVINGGLGHRNFNAFLNGYRIAEAKAALADPAQADVPVLTIAMDAGFNSLGPFNRAFKSETGLTPSEYRRGALRTGFDDVAVNSASRISKSA